MDELVFTVAGADAKPAQGVSLQEIGLGERQHLQEWAIRHPEILGHDVKVVTVEFDRWAALEATPQDRLDILGIEPSGQLVVAELKRDVAPDTVEMQAIKYAAMASRFTPETLAAAHAAFLKQRGDIVSDTDAMDRLLLHLDVEALTPDVLRQPRIVLLASSFPPVVTATAVWLREMGIDMTLVRFQAYRTEGETLVTVSQQLPVPSVEEFTVIPRVGAVATGSMLPTIEWTTNDLQRFASMLTDASVPAMMDLCADRPGEYVTFAEVVQRSGRNTFEVRSDLAWLTQTVKRQFERSNWPVEVTRDPANGTARYRLASDLASAWRSRRSARAAAATDEGGQ